MPERVILSTYPLLDFLTRLLTRVRVLFLLILPLPDSYHGSKNLDFEENIVDTNAYTLSSRYAALICSSAPTKVDTIVCSKRSIGPLLSKRSIGQAALDAF